MSIYLQRFLSNVSVMRSKLQLVGAASMYIASKLEEIYPPEIGDFAYITDDTYTKVQVSGVECLMMQPWLCHYTSSLEPGSPPHMCDCLLYTSPSPRDATLSRMPSSA